MRDPVTGQCKKYFATSEVTPALDAGNPVNPATDNKFALETDYAGAGAYPLAFTRAYNSAAPQDGALGVGWQHGYARRLSPEYSAPPPPYTGAPGQSSLYATEQAACEAGWAQVRGQLTAVPGEATTAVYEAGGWFRNQTFSASFVMASSPGQTACKSPCRRLRTRLFSSTSARRRRVTRLSASFACGVAATSWSTPLASGRWSQS